MTEQNRFESLVAERLAAYAAGADRPFDATGIARGAMGARPDRMSLRGLRILGWPAPALLLLALAAVLMAVAVAAVGSGLVRPPWTSDWAITPTEVAACEVLEGAIDRANIGEVIGSSVGFNHGHEEEAARWDARACAYGWDDRYAVPHLFVRAWPTSADEAEGLLGRITEAHFAAVPRFSWDRDERGWRATAVEGDDGFTAVAVTLEPWFFVVTERDEAQAYALAEAVAAEFGFDLDLEAQGGGSP